MSITLRFTGPPSPGWADDGTTWVDDLGHYVGPPVDRHFTADEAVELEGWQLVEQNPDDPTAYQPDAILLDAPGGRRVGMARTMWAVDGEPAAKVSSIPDTLARVDGNPEQARLELAAEQGRGDKARPTLVEQLTAIIGPTDPVFTPADAAADTNPEG